MSKEAWHVGHNEVRNVIHNEIGITKEEIQNIFRVIARDEMSKLLGEEREYIRGLIRSILKEVIKGEMLNVIKYENFPKVIGHTWHYYQDKGDDFKNFILNVLKTEIMDELRESFDMNLVFNTKKKEEPAVSDEYISVDVRTSKGNLFNITDECLLNINRIQELVESGMYPNDMIHVRTKHGHHMIDKDELDELIKIGWDKWSRAKVSWIEKERAKFSSERLKTATTIPLTKG